MFKKVNIFLILFVLLISITAVSAVDDVNDAYIDYFTSVVEILDTYAQTVVADMIEADETFLDKVNKARGCK